MFENRIFRRQIQLDSGPINLSPKNCLSRAASRAWRVTRSRSGKTPGSLLRARGLGSSEPSKFLGRLKEIDRPWEDDRKGVAISSHEMGLDHFQACFIGRIESQSEFGLLRSWRVSSLEGALASRDGRLSYRTGRFEGGNFWGLNVQVAMRGLRACLRALLGAKA